MNFKRIAATFTKERLLILRDPGGLSMLFLMPLLLIIVMAIIQDIPFKDYQDVKFKLLWIDEDKKPLSDSLFNFMNQSGQFEIVRNNDLDLESISAGLKQVESGKYPICILIPKGTYAEMLNKTNKIFNAFGKKMGNPSIIPVRPSLDSIKIKLYFDPAAKNTFRIAVENAIEKVLFRVQFNMLIGKISSQTSEGNNVAELSAEEVLANSIEPINLGKLKDQSYLINSVQHNVPAWIVFAIFFLVIPIAGNYIKEKQEGSRIKMLMTPGSYSDIIIGKVLLYCIIAISQFLFLVYMSRLLLPLFGLPKLMIGSGIFIIPFAALTIGFAAISLGFLIGSYFQTHHQAMMLGAILIIIMSALGGIWIPIEVLPEWMQNVAQLSPLQWGLRLINDIFLRGIVLKTFIFCSSLLILFGVLCIVLASWLTLRIK